MRLHQTSWGLLIDLDSIAAISEIRNYPFETFVISFQKGGAAQVSWELIYNQTWFQERFKEISAFNAINTLRDELISGWKGIEQKMPPFQ